MIMIIIYTVHNSIRIYVQLTSLMTGRKGLVSGKSSSANEWFAVMMHLLRGLTIYTSGKGIFNFISFSQV